MTSLTRRDVVGGVAAVALAGAAMPTIVPALAQSQAGFHRFKIGDIEVVSISDGIRRGKLAASPTKSASFEQFQDALAADGLPRDEIATSFNTLAVKNGKSLFVIDTGNGLNTACRRYRPGGTQSRRRRLRSEGRRGGHPFAFPRRPYRRADHARTRAVLPECRVARAAQRVQLLDGRRQHECRAGRLRSSQRPHECAPRVRRDPRQGGFQVRMGQGGRARHHLHRHAGTYAGSHLVPDFIGQCEP